MSLIKKPVIFFEKKKIRKHIAELRDKLKELQRDFDDECYLSVHVELASFIPPLIQELSSEVVGLIWMEENKNYEREEKK